MTKVTIFHHNFCIYTTLVLSNNQWTQRHRDICQLYSNFLHLFFVTSPALLPSPPQFVLSFYRHKYRVVSIFWLVRSIPQVITFCWTRSDLRQSGAKIPKNRPDQTLPKVVNTVTTARLHSKFDLLSLVVRWLKNLPTSKSPLYRSISDNGPTNWWWSRWKCRTSWPNS